MEYGAEVMPRFNPLNACGYHIRDAGSTAVEVALTIAAALCPEAARERGIDPDRLAPRVVLLERAQRLPRGLQAARRPPAVGRLMRERLRCSDPRRG